MRVSAFVSRLLKVVPSVPRQHLVDEINYALGIIYSRPLNSMRFRDPATGNDPVLTTTPGVFTYVIGTSTVGCDTKFVGKIYASDPSDSEDYRTGVFAQNPETGNENPTITFMSDPGDATYFVQCYRYPEEITDESQTLPMRDDEAIRYLFELVVGNMEMMMHGQSIRLEKFYADTINEFYGSSNLINNCTVYNTGERYY